ncbi:ABC transporter ATP-binding protein [Maricaulis sp. CAU 1757]
MLSAITAGAAASYAGLVRWTFEKLEAQDPSFFPLVPLVAIGLSLVRSVSLYLQTLQTNRMALHVMEDLQNAMFAKLVRSDFARLQGEPVGSLVSRFTNDITLLRETLVRLANNLVRDVFQIIAVIAWMLWIDWALTLLILVVYPIAAWPVVKIGQRLRKTSSLAQSQMGTVTSQLEESFSGTRMVKTYSLEEYELDRAKRSFRDRLKFLFRITENKARVDPILEIVGGLAFAGLVAFAGLRLISGETTIGSILGILTAIAILSPPVRAIGTLNAVVQEGFAVLERVFGVLDEPEEVTAPLRAPTLEVTHGGVIFDNVSFAYPDGTPALKALSLDVEAGKTVALVGASGSGKSTIINLLPRLYDPQSGAILIDGTDIRSVSIASLRQAMALVSQDATLFDDSVRANIGFGDLEADNDAIIEAAKAADAHDFIMALPDGYDSPVGARGSNLSGGQRQRLTIARAILKNAPILLLDEATSALDTQSEQRVQAALDRLTKDRTTLVIAHRLSTVRQADLICVLEDGEIREQGRHDELLMKGGLYADLCRVQFGDSD